jgi:hypothetical protein
LQGQGELLHPQSRIRDLHQISRDKFDRFPRATTEFTLCVLDRYGLRDHWPARPTLTPQIRFLYIGSRFCSTLPSDPASRRRPCASLSLHLYQVVKRTCTSKPSNMLGVHRDRGSSHLLAPPTPPYRRVRIRRFSKLSPRGPEVRVIVRHKGFATLQVSVSASPSSEPVKLSRS